MQCPATGGTWCHFVQRAPKVQYPRVATTKRWHGQKGAKFSYVILQKQSGDEADKQEKGKLARLIRCVLSCVFHRVAHSIGGLMVSIRLDDSQESAARHTPRAPRHVLSRGKLNVLAVLVSVVSQVADMVIDLCLLRLTGRAGAPQRDQGQGHPRGLPRVSESALGCFLARRRVHLQERQVQVATASAYRMTKRLATTGHSINSRPEHCELIIHMKTRTALCISGVGEFLYCWPHRPA
jgi:hypothetical protein